MLKVFECCKNANLRCQFEASTISHVWQAIRSTTSSNFKSTSTKVGRFGPKINLMTITWVWRFLGGCEWGYTELGKKLNIITRFRLDLGIRCLKLASRTNLELGPSFRQSLISFVLLVHINNFTNFDNSDLHNQNTPTEM